MRKAALFLFSTHLGGIHLGSWRDPNAPTDPAMGFETIKRMAQTAERGKFHAMFLADSLAHWPQWDAEGLSHTALGACLEPLTLCAALARETEHIGLMLTGNTTYNQPFHLARMFASLDHISAGRAGWNIVTGGNPNEAFNFSTGRVRREERYERAAEFVEVAKGLWDSFDDDAFVHDRDAGRFHDATKLHQLDHEGKHFSVRGPLTIARPPQGYPVIAQAGSSEEGREFAARYGEVIFTVQSELASAQAFYDEIKARAAAAGRDPQDTLIVVGLLMVLGHTQEEAETRMAQLDSLVDPLIARDQLSGFLFFDLSDYPLDGPLPEIPVTEVGTQGIQAHFLAIARSQKLTIRQASAVAARSGALAMSTQAAADHIEQWIEAKAADGFNLTFADQCGSLDMFVDEVVPDLQRRGVFHLDYEGSTLRENLGLRRPVNRCSAAAAKVGRTPGAVSDQVGLASSPAR
jgi:FMN-dependent oxidoreductase (nitrilotriacetate monooxygenase family)